MRSLAAAIVLVVCHLLSGVQAIGVTDCSGPSSSVLSVQSPLTDIMSWNDGETVVVEGRVQSIAGEHGRRTFFLRSSDYEAVVLVLSLSDMDMADHDGQLVRVEGTLNTAATGGIVKTLLLSAARPMEEEVLMCHQPLQHRSLRMGHNHHDIFAAHVTGEKIKDPFYNSHEDPAYKSHEEPRTRRTRGHRQ